MIRFYYHQNPANMTDDQWAKAVSEIQYCLHLEKRMTGAAIAEILSLIKN